MIDRGSQVYAVIIVGGGPAGLSAALMLGRCLRKVAVFDAGEPRNAAAQGIHGYLGHDGIAPAELRQRGRAEIARYGVEHNEDVVAKAMQAPEAASARCPTCFRVETRGGRKALCRKLLLATGM